MCPVYLGAYFEICELTFRRLVAGDVIEFKLKWKALISLMELSSNLTFLLSLPSILVTFLISLFAFTYL